MADKNKKTKTEIDNLAELGSGRFRDPNLINAIYDLVDVDGTLIELSLRPEKSHYEVDLLDVTKNELIDINVIYPKAGTARIYDEQDLNIFLQRCFPKDTPQIDSTTKVTEWESAVEQSEIRDDQEVITFVTGMNIMLDSIKNAVYAESAERIGSDIYLMNGDVIARVSFKKVLKPSTINRHKPELEK